MVARGWVALPAVLAACGRLHFDAAAVGGPDAASPDARVVPWFQDICAYSTGLVLQNGTITDDSTALAMASALSVNCGTADVVLDSQDTPGLLDPTTHRPLFGASELGIAGGGPASQKVLQYLELADTPIEFAGDATNMRFVERATGQVVLDVPNSALNATHQVGTVMLVCDPDVPPCVLVAYGQDVEGTVAGGYLFDNVIAPSIGTNRQRWYVFDWVNADGDPNPSAGDTLTVVAMGT